MPKIENVVDRFNLVVTTAKNITSAVLFAVGAIGVAVWFGAAVISPAWLWACAATMLGLAAIWLGFRRYNTGPQLNSEFVIQDLHMTYVIDAVDHRRHRITRRYTLRARTSDATIFSFSYAWSGAGKVSPAATSTPGHRIIADTAGYSTDRVMVVHLGRPHARGEIVTVEVNQDLYDEYGLFGHFIAKIVQHNMEFLRLSIQFPPQLPFSPEVRASIDIRNRRSVWICKRTLNDEVIHAGDVWSITIARPRPIGANFMLSWTWDGSY